jgi:hypothetical protein
VNTGRFALIYFCPQALTTNPTDNNFYNYYNKGGSFQSLASGSEGGSDASEGNSSDCRGGVLECAGVNVEGSLFNNGEKTPKILVEPSYNDTNVAIDEDYDYYNRKKMRDAGINIGTFFWEPENLDAPPKNESDSPSPEQQAADEDLARIIEEKSDITSSPEERLSR